MTRRRRLLLVLGGLLIAGGTYAGWQYGHPAPPPASEYLPVADPAPGALRARFFGTTTLLLDDGRNAVMVDALLTRPGMGDALFGKIASDPALIGRILKRGNVGHVDLLLVTHSHYDHALDAPEIARRTGAMIVGSPSTREIALGGGIDERGIRVVKGGERLDADEFHVTVFRARHSPDDRVPGDITAPLRQPATLRDYKEGGTLAFLIEHRGLRMLVQASANDVPGLYRGTKADVVFLAVGGLGAQSPEFAQRYWHEVVEMTGAKLVVPIHWDDFLRPLDKPQLPLRRMTDDFPEAMSKVEPLAKRDGVAIRYMPVIAPVDITAATK